ncbi:MAG: DUF5009 domain-containing protein [Porphyromonadaceae bacterium]|nr:DUF5009 domain-containing protein [Porphyromonadaceae bacterium]
MEKLIQPQRLASLDILRGFDLFCLVVLESMLHPLSNAIDSEWFHKMMWFFTHMEWEGFSSWDLVMPLFLFMSGVSIPFAFSRYKAQRNKTLIYRRIAKRVVLLWIFGMMCQGNLLAFDSQNIAFYSNTLQSIAMGYLIASLAFLHLKQMNQMILAGSFLIIYWAVMTFITVDGFGGGNFTPDGNLAEWIDRTLLGRFRDGVSWENGVWSFAPWYRYTWILSSLNFGVTVMSGVFAGQLLKSNRSEIVKLKWLLYAGLIMVALGWLWGFQMPVIKKLWTSSMVLVSSGYCFLLMALFYWWIDYKKHNRDTTLFKIYGMNSITAYMITNVVSFRCVGESLFFGLQPHLGNYYPVLISLCNVSVIYVILWLMYKHKLFLKV